MPVHSILLMAFIRLCTKARGRWENRFRCSCRSSFGGGATLGLNCIARAGGVAVMERTLVNISRNWFFTTLVMEYFFLSRQMNGSYTPFGALCWHCQEKGDGQEFSLFAILKTLHCNFSVRFSWEISSPPCWDEGLLKGRCSASGLTSVVFLTHHHHCLTHHLWSMIFLTHHDLSLSGSIAPARRVGRGWIQSTWRIWRGVLFV